MALNAYLRLKGQKQGEIKGSVTQKGREGSIMIFAFRHDIVSPRDAASGLPTGKRQHKPITILKEIDKSSPCLYNALVNNENIPELSIEFWTPQLKAASGTGSEVQHYTIKLTNANMCEMREYSENNKIPGNMALPLFEEVSFTYQKIEWTWKDGGITADDDWEAPNV